MPDSVLSLGNVLFYASVLVVSTEIAPNHILDRILEHDRPFCLAWIKLVANGAILTDSVIGPLIAGYLGLSAALALYAAARLLAAIAVWRWG